MALAVGSKAPSFNLEDKDRHSHRLSDFKSDYTILYFYPRDNTPGCTIEAKSFNKNLARFAEYGAAIVGISGGDEKSKETFCRKHRLEITLLSDPDFAVSKSYGSFGEKSFMGRKFKGIYRKTFVLDKKHRVLRIYDKVNPLSHSKEILEYLKSLSDGN